MLDDNGASLRGPGERAYISASFKGEDLLLVRPEISVASKVISEMVQWLPSEHDCAIGGAVEEGPVHWLALANPGGASQVFNGSLCWHHVHARVSIARHQMHVRQL